MILIDGSWKDAKSIKETLWSSNESFIKISEDCKLSDFSFLSDFKTIRRIEITKKIPIDFVNTMDGLKEIFGQGCVLNFELANANVEILRGAWTPKFSVSEKTASLHTLGIKGCKNPSELFNILQRIKSLKSLELGNCSVCDFNCLHPLHGLESLEITKFRNLMALDGLECLAPNLKELRINYAGGLESYDALQKIKTLETLIIFKSRNIKSLNFCKFLPKLKDLRIVSTKIETNPDEELQALFGRLGNAGFFET